MKSSRGKTVKEEVKGKEIASPQSSWAAKSCSLSSSNRDSTSPDFVLSLNQELFTLRRWSNGKMRRELRKKWDIKRRRVYEALQKTSPEYLWGWSSYGDASLDNRVISDPFFCFFHQETNIFVLKCWVLYSTHGRVWTLVLCYNMPIISPIVPYNMSVLSPMCVVPTTCLLSLQCV